jgi:aminocarboxymuconate-semialdehyde decarboxylase
MNQTSSTSGAVVDTHAHVVPKRLFDQLHAGEVRFPHVEVSAEGDTYRVAFSGGTPTRPIAPGLTDLPRRTAWLDDNGIDLQLVGGWLDVFGYDLPAGEAGEWATTLTEAIREETVGDDRYLPLGTVPLAQPDEAAEAVAKQRAGGLSGLMIGTRAVPGMELDDAAYVPFWEAADETGALVFLHPGFGATTPRYADFGLVNGLGRLEDTTVTLARLLYAGIPARYPGARIVVAHGGAALPYVLGRLEQNHALNPQTTCDPRESFSLLHFDSVVFDPEALRFLVRTVGADRVLLGSDYPFPIGDLRPRQVLEGVPLADADRELIEGGNARRMIGDEAS